MEGVIFELKSFSQEGGGVAFFQFYMVAFGFDCWLVRSEFQEEFHLFLQQKQEQQEEEAATKLQALQRGKRARQRTQARRVAAGSAGE